MSRPPYSCPPSPLSSRAENLWVLVRYGDLSQLWGQKLVPARGRPGTAAARQEYRRTDPPLGCCGLLLAATTETSVEAQGPSSRHQTTYGVMAVEVLKQAAPHLPGLAPDPLEVWQVLAFCRYSVAPLRLRPSCSCLLTHVCHRLTFTAPALHLP